MAEERNEPATAKRKSDAREKGQVAKSPEIGSAFILLTGFIILWMFGHRTLNYLMSYMKWMYSPVVMVHLPLTQVNVGYIFLDMFAFCARVLAPIAIGLVIVAILVNYYQVGFQITTKAIMPNFQKLNPLNGFKRLISFRAIVELIKNIIKISLIGYIAYSTIKNFIPTYMSMIDMGVREAFYMLCGNVLTLALKIAFLLLILAAADYIYQKYEHEKSLKMTKQEIKEEYKQREGDPLVRSRIRQKQREAAMRRMMADVPKADVVITNPIRLAIALQYVSEEMHAPRVVAKGGGSVAERIRALAKENNVPIVEDRWLAQSLFKMSDVGEYVPASLFKAVAEVLAYVYRMGAKRHKFGI